MRLARMRALRDIAGRIAAYKGCAHESHFSQMPIQRCFLCKIKNVACAFEIYSSGSLKGGIEFGRGGAVDYVGRFFDKIGIVTGRQSQIWQCDVAW